MLGTFVVAIIGSFVISTFVHNLVLMLPLCFAWGWFSKDIADYIESWLQ